MPIVTIADARDRAARLVVDHAPPMCVHPRGRVQVRERRVEARQVVPYDAFNSVHRKQIIELEKRFALPANYSFPYFAAEGRLMSYGIDQIEQYRRAAIYIDRILNSATRFANSKAD